MRTYQYDHANRLKQVIEGTLTTQFAYNGDGVRASKTVDSATTDYVVDLAATLPVVISDTDAVYLYGLDIIAEQLAGADRYYYVHDGLGSVRQLVGNTGQIEEAYAYDPFGVPLVGNGVANPWRFTGEAWDSEVELLYLRARYYEPTTGRFITKDPWSGDRRSPGTLNAYLYVTNNPVNLVDPRGRNGEDPLGFLLEPEVVTYIHRQMVDNVQGPVVRFVWMLNLDSSPNAMPDWTDWIPVIKELKEARRIPPKVAAFAIFGSMVRQGGPWDPKRHIERNFSPRYSQQIGDYYYSYDIWGNIMFGYLGAAAGFSSSELLNGAGLEQIGSDIGYTIQHRNPCLLPRPRPVFHVLRLSAWDHPPDRVTAIIGIRLWYTHKGNVKPRHIVEAVKEAGDNRGIPRGKQPLYGEGAP